MKLGIQVSALSILCLAISQAQAAVMVYAEMTGSPAAGLETWILGARSDDGTVINSIAGVNIASGVHQVRPAFAPETVTAAQWNPPAGAGLAEWAAFDTYLLFNPGNAADVVGFIGSATESNDGSDPAGLNLENFGQPAMTGLGGYRFGQDTDQLVLTPGAASTDVQFLQVVIPAGTVAPASGAVFDVAGNRIPFDVGVGIPEPASFALAGLGLLGLAAARRRSR